MEREQYEWMLDFLLDILKGHPSEDEIMMQYINVGLSKATAVIGLVSKIITDILHKYIRALCENSSVLLHVVLRH